MATIYNKRGNSVFIQNDNDLDMSKHLDPAIYTIKQTAQGELFLSKLSDTFILPDKMYGEVEDRSDRVIETFNKRSSSTGAIFAGNQGSGKTLVSKQISNKCIKAGIPVIIVTAPYAGDRFNEFIDSIECECVILFEEFEKVYSDYDNQEKLLTLFEGVYQNKKLFLLTINASNLVRQLINRPGRVYYVFKYAGLSELVVQQYCDDNLKDKSKLKQISLIARMFGDVFNFDMLQAIVQESNLYPNDSIQDILSILNIENKDHSKYRCTSVTVNGVKRYPNQPSQTYKEILTRGYTEVYLQEEEPDNKDELMYAECYPQYVTSVDMDEGVVIFGNQPNGIEARFERILEVQRPISVTDYL